LCHIDLLFFHLQLHSFFFAQVMHSWWLYSYVLQLKKPQLLIFSQRIE
jgi:hypothetical protein